ncbi:MAG: flagellar motor switch protein FliM [Yoonia sp.]|jgi:flagellar motor switch protein FliM
MTESTHAILLRRMTRSQEADVAENPLTSSRAVRLALTKAANSAAGLVLTVTSVVQDVSALDAMLEGLPDGLMLVGLHRQGQLVGLIALDMQLRAAVLEMEKMGVLSVTAVDDRAPTHTDKVLCEPLIAAFLAAFPEAVRWIAFDG